MKEFFLKNKFSNISFISSSIFLVIIIIKSIVIFNGNYDNNMVILPLLLCVISIISFIFSKNEPRSLIKSINYFIIYPVLISEIFYLISLLNSPLIILSILSIIVVIIIKLIKYIQDKDDFEEYANGSDVVDDDGITEVEVSKGDFTLGNIYKHNVDEEGNVPEGEDEYIPSEKKAHLKLGDRFVHTIVLGVTGSGKTSQSLLPMVLQDFTSDNFSYKQIDVVQMGQIILEPKGDFAKSAWAIGKIKEDEKKVNYINFLLEIPKKINKKIYNLMMLRKSFIDKENGVELNQSDSEELLKLEKIINNSINNYSQLEQVQLYSKYDKLLKIANGSELTIEEKQSLLLTEDSIKKLIQVKEELPNYIDLTKYTVLRNISTYALFKYSALLTDIISNPDYLESSWEELKQIDKQQQRDLVVLFDPSSKNSPYFNPLYGPEETAVGTVTTTVLAFMADSNDFFQNLGKTLLQNAIHVAKRIYKNDAVLNNINDLLTNNGGRGEEMIRQLSSLDVKSEQALENKDFANYFINEYYAGLKGARGASKTYEQTSGVRSIINNLLDNKRLRKVLNPPTGIGTDIDFDRILKDGDKVALSTSTGVSDELGKMLGSFLILQLQAAIFRRPGNEDTRVPVILYIDEFQDYASSSFEDVLTKGRSYAVSATMATQTLGIVGSKAGMGLVENLQSNARNVIVYPGSSSQDANYFVSLFGEYEKTQLKRSVSQGVEDEKTRLEEIRNKLSISDDESSGGGPRESISTETKSINRFSVSQVIYGPNVNQRGTGSNDSFGFVFYRININNSVQIPSVAKIEYIPRDIKVESDKLIAAYDSVNKLSLDDKDDVIDDEINTVDDPMSDEDVFISDFSKIFDDANNESDPEKILRDKDGKEIIENISIDNSEKIKEIEKNIDIENSSLEEEKLDEEKNELPELPEIPELPDFDFNEIPTDIKKNPDDEIKLEFEDDSY